MSVYVDPLFDWGGSATFPWKRSCHMFADDLGELHQLAQKIGMRRAWFQDHRGLPHYDLVGSRRARAVVLGAIEVTQKQMVEFMRWRLIDGQTGSFAEHAGICQQPQVASRSRKRHTALPTETSPTFWDILFDSQATSASARADEWQGTETDQVGEVSADGTKPAASAIDARVESLRDAEHDRAAVPGHAVQVDGSSQGSALPQD